MRHVRPRVMPCSPRRGAVAGAVLASLFALTGCDVFGGGGDGGDGSCSADGACDHGESCEASRCVVGERCGDVICDATEVCGADACVASPYDQDYVLVMFSAHAKTKRTLSGHLSLGTTRVVTVPSTPEATHDVLWDVSTTVTVGAWQPFEVVLFQPGERSLLSERFDRVPYELLRDGEMVFGDDQHSVVVRAWPPGAVPECLLDVECAGGEHCQDRACAVGDRCDATVCAASDLCGDGACVANTFDTAYTLTLVGAKLASGQWDTGFDGTPDPKATVLVDGEVVLVGPEQVDTYEASWNLDVTRVFDPYAAFRVQVLDVDLQGGDLAIDTSYPRFPYALVRDGTLTITQGSSSVTLTLTR
ncbi:MAG: hypothetical protein EP329_16035 [Deltaproteobacteria bacterium]|nr:MAG: hypothetical protein EP329_16035 [Deltaproteobacteria bacterium]